MLITWVASIKLICWGLLWEFLHLTSTCQFLELCIPTPNLVSSYKCYIGSSLLVFIDQYVYSNIYLAIQDIVKNSAGKNSCASNWIVPVAYLLALVFKITSYRATWRIYRLTLDATNWGSSAARHCHCTIVAVSKEAFCMVEGLPGAGMTK